MTKLEEREEDRRRGRAGKAAAEAEKQEMALEFARDVAVLGADEMEHRDHVAVARHGAARGEDDAEDRGDEDQREDREADDHGGVRHGAGAAPSSSGGRRAWRRGPAPSAGWRGGEVDRARDRRGGRRSVAGWAAR